MTAARLRLSASDRELLLGGSAVLGVVLDAAAMNDLARFADLLDLWCPRVNLVSCGSAPELIERHFLDSLAITPLVPDSGIIVDLGSGAGFPGLPLAITRRDQKMVLVEARRKRVSFLREAKRTLGLANVEIVEGRAEDPPKELSHRAASVVSRAVWSEPASMAVAAEWLEPGGRLYWIRTDRLTTPGNMPAFVATQTVSYRIGQDRPRTVEVLQYEPSGVHCST